MSTHTATINVLRTLCLLGQKGGRLGISDVMDDLGVSRATAYRYLSYLEAFGLASRFGRGDFILGPEVNSLEKAARTGDPLAAAAMPVIDSLRRNTGATVLLERVAGQRRLVVLAQSGVSGPERLADLCRAADSVPCNVEHAKIVDGATALKIWIQSEAGDAPDQRVQRVGKRHPDVDQDLACMLDGEKIDATVYASTVQLRGLVVCRVVALLRPGEVDRIDPASVEEQVRRAALRIEGRLEAEL